VIIESIAAFFVVEKLATYRLYQAYGVNHKVKDTSRMTCPTTETT